MNIYLLVAMKVTIMCSAVSFSTGISDLKAINLFIPQILIFLIIYFNWRIITCNIVMVFAIHQHESAAGIYVFPPFWPPPTSRLSQSTGFPCPVSCIELALVIYFTYGNVCVSMLFLQMLFSHPCLLLLSSKVCLLHLYLPCCPACRIVSTVFLNSIRSDQLLSRVRLFATPWIAARQASLSITNSRTEFTETHVHWVSDAIQPSHPLSSPSPPAPNPSQHQSLFQWVNSSHEVAKVLEFQL